MTCREERNERSRRWYYENRERVLAEHKERMANDLEYRARQKEIRRKTDAKRYAKLKASRPPVKLDNASREIDGTVVQTFTLRESARLLGIGHSTLSCWLKRGHIPEPLFREPILFTRQQVELMRRLAAAGDKRTERVEAKQHIFEHWNWI